jgi:HAD superfamily hydrolase (TIGR01509 family)
MRALRAVVFDVDGTLVDSERHGHRVAFNEAFAVLGLPYEWDEQTYGELLAVTGGVRRLRHYLRQRGHDDEAAKVMATFLHRRKTELFRELCTQGCVPPRPGVGRLMDDLAGDGVVLGVATTGTRAWVEPLLDRLFGLNRFACVLTGSEVPALKPRPDVYTETVRRLRVSPAATVAVEDSANGVAAATASGLTCVAVANDYTAKQDLSAAAAAVDGFGRPGIAHLLDGRSDVLDDGAVTSASLARMLSAAHLRSVM